MREKSVAVLVVSVIGIVSIAFSALGIYWSDEPEPFNVVDQAIIEAKVVNRPVVVGTATTAALIHEIDVLLNKRGGYLSNDITPPGIFLDNIPHWEYGVLMQIRDLTRAMRDRISRSQSQSKEDEDLAITESRFNISNTAWIMPDAQSEYKAGADHLHSYLKRLSDTKQPDAQFYARADNLSYWLGIVEVRLGGLSQRLSASVGQKRLNTDLAGDSAAQQSTSSKDEMVAKTSMFEIDDVFYEARGTAWALIHLLQAIEVDFAEVLKKKNAQVSMAQIIRELEATQEPLKSPIILNGSGFGMWANHSLVMASYISRANAAIIDLRELLENG